jgi:hypothetical protein
MNKCVEETWEFFRSFGECFFRKRKFYSTEFYFLKKNKNKNPHKKN